MARPTTSRTSVGGRKSRQLSSRPEPPPVAVEETEDDVSSDDGEETYDEAADDASSDEAEARAHARRSLARRASQVALALEEEQLFADLGGATGVRQRDLVMKWSLAFNLVLILAFFLRAERGVDEVVVEKPVPVYTGYTPSSSSSAAAAAAEPSWGAPWAAGASSRASGGPPAPTGDGYGRSRAPSYEDVLGQILTPESTPPAIADKFAEQAAAAAELRDGVPAGEATREADLGRELGALGNASTDTAMYARPTPPSFPSPPVESARADARPASALSSYLAKVSDSIADAAALEAEALRQAKDHEKDDSPRYGLVRLQPEALRRELSGLGHEMINRLRTLAYRAEAVDARLDALAAARGAVADRAHAAATTERSHAVRQLAAGAADLAERAQQGVRLTVAAPTRVDSLLNAFLVTCEAPGQKVREALAGDCRVDQLVGLLRMVAARLRAGREAMDHIAAGTRVTELEYSKGSHIFGKGG